MKITRDELEAINRALYNCETCKYPSYRDKNKVFCSCCFRKCTDPNYWDKVKKKYHELFESENARANILAEKKKLLKSNDLILNERGLYQRKKKKQKVRVENNGREKDHENLGGDSERNARRTRRYGEVETYHTRRRYEERLRQRSAN